MKLQDSIHRFDVAILGSGLSGSMLACVLARQDVSAVLIEGGTHPRFAVGESTIPHTSLLTLLQAQKYGVPELENIAHPDRIAMFKCIDALETLFPIRIADHEMITDNFESIHNIACFVSSKLKDCEAA